MYKKMGPCLCCKNVPTGKSFQVYGNDSSLGRIRGGQKKKKNGYFGTYACIILVYTLRLVYVVYLPTDSHAFER